VWFGGGMNPKTKQPYENRPMYAKRAMAQTRAVSRVCRSAFAFVVVLIDSGLSTTPYEEMADLVIDSDAVKAAAPVGAAALKAQLSPNPAAPSPPKAARRLVVDANEPPHTADSGPGEGMRQHPAITFRYGKLKGSSSFDVQDKDLEWYIGGARKSVDDPEKERFRAANQQELDALLAEQAWRAGREVSDEKEKPALPMIFGSGPMADAMRAEMAKDPDRYRPQSMDTHPLGRCPCCELDVYRVNGRITNFEEGFATGLEDDAIVHPRVGDKGKPAERGLWLGCCCVPPKWGPKHTEKPKRRKHGGAP
jgi:hypothetical protein